MIKRTLIKRTDMAKRKKNVFVRLIIFIVILALLAGAAYYTFNVVKELLLVIHEDQENESIYKKDINEGIIFEIEMGNDASQIADKLLKEGIIEDTRIFIIWSKINGYDYLYKSGRHIIGNDLKVEGLLGYDRLMRILIQKPLANPEVNLFIREGLTYDQTKELFLENNLILSDRFDKTAKEFTEDYDFIKQIPIREKRLEGYLFPETYRFTIPFDLNEEGSEEEILTILLRQFNKIFKPEYYERAEALGMTVDEIITVASIVEKEAMDPEEREIIAGVFYNRLKSKTEYLNYLQSCSTVQYALLERDGKVKETLLHEDLEIDHPYNTYKIKGLPPGPICNPGLASIIAALYPAEHDYYYFVAKGDGTHAFARTDREHQNNIRKYQNQ
jgi:UPF0755 protein